MTGAYAEGYDDGYLTGERSNPYDKETETDKWLSYNEGFDAGLNRFIAEESTPIGEQIALSGG